LGALKNPSTFRELGRDGTLEVVEEGELEEPRSADRPSTTARNVPTSEGIVAEDRIFSFY
jgi:hypothetical protein